MKIKELKHCRTYAFIIIEADKGKRLMLDPSQTTPEKFFIAELKEELPKP